VAGGRAPAHPVRRVLAAVAARGRSGRGRTFARGDRAARCGGRLRGAARVRRRSRRCRFPFAGRDAAGGPPMSARRMLSCLAIAALASLTRGVVAQAPQPALDFANAWFAMALPEKDDPDAVAAAGLRSVDGIRGTA